MAPGEEREILSSVIRPTLLLPRVSENGALVANTDCTMCYCFLENRECYDKLGSDKCKQKKADGKCTKTRYKEKYCRLTCEGCVTNIGKCRGYDKTMLFCCAIVRFGIWADIVR